ncbi:hypothetical protein ACQEVF_25425 [Nonomuraea polychroma]|uniref:hypothetical protein n=1 Tax=Nonomuraea polychroma TaxID=46176 RepID=UPI003D8FA3FF
METDTAISARQQLEQLRAELESRGWEADHRGTEERPFLHVRNPADAGFHDSVACLGDRYVWNWGPEIGLADDVQAVADRIMHVLRVVGP